METCSRCSDSYCRFSTRGVWCKQDDVLLCIYDYVSWSTEVPGQSRILQKEKNRYLLGQTIGGIFCSPISEVFGRRTIYIIAAVAFCISSAIVAAIPSIAAVYVGRFFQGVAAAIPATVAFGNFEDMYDAEHRIWVVYIYTILGMLGLVLGPIYSTYITSSIGW